MCYRKTALITAGNAVFNFALLTNFQNRFMGFLGGGGGGEEDCSVWGHTHYSTRRLSQIAHTYTNIYLHINGHLREFTYKSYNLSEYS